jgi:hypothetical protein
MMRDNVLQGLESFADAYIDDVEVDTATTFVQHLIHLREVFNSGDYVNLSYARGPVNVKSVSLL